MLVKDCCSRCLFWLSMQNHTPSYSVMHAIFLCALCVCMCVCVSMHLGVNKLTVYTVPCFPMNLHLEAAASVIYISALPCGFIIKSIYYLHTHVFIQYRNRNLRMERTIGPGHRDSLHLRRYNQKCYRSYMSI